MRRRLDGLVVGEHTGLRTGPGSQAEELTAYRPGADVRRIDWRASARARDLQVWRTQAEHELTCWLLLDQTASMAFGTVGLEKAELATTVAAAYGLLTDRPGNRLGVARLTTTGLSWGRLRPGRQAAVHVLRSDPAPREGPAVTSLAEALQEMGRRCTRSEVIVVVTDLLEPSGRVERPFDWEPALRRLARRHEVAVVEVIDPRELDLPAVGQLVLVDPESGHQRSIDSDDHRLRQAYRQHTAAHRSATAAAVRSAGAGHLPLHTDTDWPRALADFLRSRRRRAPRPASAGRPPGLAGDVGSGGSADLPAAGAAPTVLRPENNATTRRP
ncbi:DUF58 domain-containing protein [Quadrisphaera sp. KR29]|uniref:DUF58 domain-containing protein n=1 Tax=Quadrisphaera sp. KR29 TaxID=3461391 RepID=UPI004044D1A0